MLVLGKKKHHRRGHMNTGQHTGFWLFYLAMDDSAGKKGSSLS